jgi:hypothetical protein
MKRPATSLVGRLSLKGLAGLLGRCDVVVSNDSGPLHLAAAVGASTVGIFWGMNLINAGPFFRRLHRPLLGWLHACSVCGRDLINNRCEHAASSVADVAVEDVIFNAIDLLRTRARDRMEMHAAPNSTLDSTVGGVHDA